jgi:TonB family protein
MPTLTLKEMQALELKDEKAEPPAPAKEITTAEDKPLPENKDDFIDNQEKPQASFSDMLKKLGGRANDKKLPIKKNDNTSKGKGKLDSKSKQELSQLLVAGNKLSQGTALVGDSEAQDLTELEKYAASLPEKIKTFWRLPSYLMDQPLNCRVRVYIAPDGRLLNAVLFSSSGNAEFDQRAIQSIQQSAPFSPPENSYKDRAARGDIVLGFPL